MKKTRYVAYSYMFHDVISDVSDVTPGPGGGVEKQIINYAKLDSVCREKNNGKINDVIIYMRDVIIDMRQ